VENGGNNHVSSQKSSLFSSTEFDQEAVAVERLEEPCNSKPCIPLLLHAAGGVGFGSGFLLALDDVRDVVG
jgi:hypothetical protein